MGTDTQNFLYSRAICPNRLGAPFLDTGCCASGHEVPGAAQPLTQNLGGARNRGLGTRRLELLIERRHFSESKFGSHRFSLN